MTAPTTFAEALVEIVAKALWCKAQDVLPWDKGPPQWRDKFLQQAYVALTALAEAGYVILPREPTRAMSDAGYAAAAEAYPCEGPVDSADVYRAMRDAAMGGKG